MQLWRRFAVWLAPPARQRARLRVVVYTRAGCHLCDVAVEELRRCGLTPQLVDIDADPLLRDRFDHLVPVVEIEGKIRFRGRVNPVLLRRLLSRLRPETG